MKERMTPYPLESVAVEDEFCANALHKEAAYLLRLSEGRLLAGFYENAGKKSAFVRYGGWESGLMGGHTMGHFLSALAQAAVNPGLDADDRKALREKLFRIVNALAECQNASGNGFLWGAPLLKKGGIEGQFDNVERGRTNIRTQAWVPWYTMHKLLAGVLDVWKHLRYAPALAIAEKLGDWTYARAARWDASVRRKVLSVEYGGMNDALYSLYAVTRKREHLAAARLFDEEELFDLILTEGKDVLKDRHANTTIPKILGALNRYFVSDEESEEGEKGLRVAESFFKTIVERHTYVTGGNSEWEHFGADYVLDAERTNCNCETCNVYNMLKLSRLLFAATGEKKYADYYDAAFTNQILGSQNPETGMTTYFQPMASGFFKVFSTPEESFWCCTGSGMESFTKLGDGIYYRAGKNVCVERYLSSVLRGDGLTLRQRAGFPFRSEAVFTVERAPEPFLLLFRVPDWAAGEVSAKKNGTKVNLLEGNGHVALAVREGDEIELTVPVEATLKGLPDGKDAFAFRFGGTVLCADLGDEEMTVATTGVDVLIPEKRKLATERVYFPDLFSLFERPGDFLERRGEEFLLKGGDLPLRLKPFNRTFFNRYAIYLRLREGKREGEEAAPREPYDAVQPGYGQYEIDALHELEESRSVGLTAEGSCRYARAGGFFSYDFAVLPGRRNVLSVCLRARDNGKPLRVSIGETVLFEGRLLYTLGEERYRMEFPIPEAAFSAAREKTAGGTKRTVLRVRFEGTKTAASARICDFLYIFAEIE